VNRRPTSVLASRRIAQAIPKQFDLPVGSCEEVRLEWRDTMKALALKVQRFLVCEDGPTAVEYAVMLALIVIVCLTAISAVGSKASTTFKNVSDQLGNS
jgi:pilus assembly protein Flp/PilA